jgi:putative component of membrane protein insertase Oxa1/YidC/SpoIIIJ protein YidD
MRPHPSLRKRLAAQACLFAALAAIAANLQGLAVAAIGAYQEFLPHAWKRSCAFQNLQGKESCSVYARRAIGEAGFLPGMRLSLDRFEACGRLKPPAPAGTEQAGQQQGKRKEERKEEEER